MIAIDSSLKFFFTIYSDKCNVFWILITNKLYFNGSFNRDSIIDFLIWRMLTNNKNKLMLYIKKA